MGKRKYTDSDLAAIADRVAAGASQYWQAADDETRAAGAGWYPIAHAEADLLAKTADISLESAAAIVAVLSPLTRWTGNLEDSWAVISGDPARHSLPRNVDKARRILSGEAPSSVVGGKKVTAFWRNILDPLTFSGTVNDSWIADAFGIDRREIFSVIGVYEAVTLGLQRAAELAEVLPSTMQATVWLQIRDQDTNFSSIGDDLPITF